MYLGGDTDNLFVKIFLMEGYADISRCDQMCFVFIKARYGKINLRTPQLYTFSPYLIYFTSLLSSPAFPDVLSRISILGVYIVHNRIHY